MFKYLKIKIYLSTLVLSLMLIVASPAYAGFGVSPSDIVHENIRPGGSFEQTITLSRSDPSGNLEILIEPSLDAMESWFSYEPGMKFIFPDGQKRFTFKTLIKVPADAPLKFYEGLIRVKAQSGAGTTAGVSVIQGSRISVNLNVTDAEVVTLVAKRLKMRDVNGTETLKLDMDVTNGGTTPASPVVKLTILNLQQEELEQLEATNLPAVSANETKAITAEFDSKIGNGEYFAVAEVRYNDQLIREERLVFRVSGRGEAALVGKTEPDDVSSKPDDTKATGLITQENIALLGLLFALLIVGYLAFVRGKKQSDQKTDKKTKKFTPSRKYATYSSLLILMFVGVFAWRNSYLFTQLLAQPEETVTTPELTQSSSTPTPAPTPIVEEVVETGTATQAAGLVQGVIDLSNELEKTEIEPTAVPEPLLVKSNENHQGFLVYAEQNTASKVVYEAEDGESFNVLEENSRWYRILLPTGIDGWLLKSSVKSVQPVAE